MPALCEDYIPGHYDPNGSYVAPQWESGIGGSATQSTTSTNDGWGGASSSTDTAARAATKAKESKDAKKTPVGPGYGAYPAYSYPQAPGSSSNYISDPASAGSLDH
jgi:hypothetical protein